MRNKSVLEKKLPYRVYRDKTTAPGVNDDATAGYLVGDIWIDETADKIYQCMDNTDGAAVWAEVGVASGAEADHIHDTRYYTETELDAGQLDNRYFTETEHLTTSAGGGDSGKPIKLDADGNVDATMINDADVDHGSLAGLLYDDHTQYHNDTRGDTRYPKKVDFDAHTILAAVSDDTPEALAIAEERIVGRITGGNIDDLTPEQVRTLAQLDGPLSPGVMTGGLISKGTEGTVTVSAITALLRTGTATTDPLIYVSLAEQANKVIGSADTVYHVGLDYNSGSPQILVQTGNFNRTTEIGLGTCMKDTSSPVRVHFANAGQRNQDGVNKLQRRATSLRRTELASGCVIGDVGGASRQFNIQKGVVYHGIYRMTPFDAAPYDPYISGDDKYFLVYGDITAGFTISDGTTDTVISNNQYWNTTTHALATLLPSRFNCFWVYIHTDDEDVYVVMGTENAKLAEAELAQPLTDLPIEITEFGLLLGCIIIERNATAFATIQMVTDTIFIGAAVADHGSLSGLDCDDHSLYLIEAEVTDEAIKWALVLGD